MFKELNTMFLDDDDEGLMNLLNGTITVKSKPRRNSSNPEDEDNLTNSYDFEEYDLVEDTEE